MKMSFIFASKYRHVILVTKDKKLQNLADSKKVLCFDFENLDNFFKQQEIKRNTKQLSLDVNSTKSFGTLSTLVSSNMEKKSD